MQKSVRIVAGMMSLAVLLSSAGCRAEMSDARRDHVLAGDHGWIDLTLKAAPTSSTYDPKVRCTVAISNGSEKLLTEAADLADTAQPAGYRFVVPVGKLQAELRLSGCIPKEELFALPLDLPKDHLARLAFDGGKLVLESTTPYEPTSLEWVRGEILKLHASNDASGAAVSRLTTLTIASLALNMLALLVFVVSRRRLSK